MSQAQKIPFFQSLNEFSKAQAQRAISLTGKALPASVVKVLIGCVEVKFELTNIPWTLKNVTVPLGGSCGSEFIRVPIQVGTKGWVQPADARLGGMSGLGASTTDLTQPSNLGALVFEPIGNKGWTAPEDPNQLELMGFNGALIKSTKNKEWYARWTTTGVTISNNAGTVAIAWNGTAWEIKGPVLCDGLLTANGGLAINGNITAPGGGTYTGNILTSGGIEAGVGTGDHVTMQAHQHTANNTPPTPGH